MQAIKPYTQIYKDFDGQKVLQKIEAAARTCYKSEGWNIWKESMKQAEDAYFKMLDFGLSPQQARAVLPNSLKTEVVMTANLREWRHFFKLRALGTTGKPHPQMLEVAVPLLEDMKNLIPVVFDDLVV